MIFSTRSLNLSPVDQPKMDDFLSHLFEGLLRLFFWFGDGASERTQALLFFGMTTLFCFIAGFLVGGVASVVLFVLAGLFFLVTLLVTTRVL